MIFTLTFLSYLLEDPLKTTGKYSQATVSVKLLLHFEQFKSSLNIVFDSNALILILPIIFHENVNEIQVNIP